MGISRGFPWNTSWFSLTYPLVIPQFSHGYPFLIPRLSLHYPWLTPWLFLDNPHFHLAMSGYPFQVSNREIASYCYLKLFVFLFLLLQPTGSIEELTLLQRRRIKTRTKITGCPGGLANVTVFAHLTWYLDHSFLIHLKIDIHICLCQLENHFWAMSGSWEICFLLLKLFVYNILLYIV